MVAPVETIASTPARSGYASLKVEVVGGESAVTSAFASSPLKLLTPRSRGRSVWVYTSSFGGGLVAGDQTRLDLHIGAGACTYLGTQASTKIYRNPKSLSSGHVTRATVESGATLVFAPDPVQAFAGSIYSQRQEFHLAPDASLVLLDWFTSGRVARGERWAFQHFQSRNEVFRDGQRILLDSLRLDPADGPMDSPHRTGRFNCLAMLLFLGPAFHQRATELLEETSQQPVTRQAPLIWSASPLADGVLMRIAGEHSESVAHEIHRCLAPCAPLLDDDPWARKW